MSAGAVSPEHQDLLLRAYAAYNTQDMDVLLATLSDDIDWPDDATRLHGKAAVRAYWAEQWTRVRADDQPSRVTQLADGRTAVHVDQVVRSLDGLVLSRAQFVHVHRIEDGRIARMDIHTILEDG